MDQCLRKMDERIKTLEKEMNHSSPLKRKLKTSPIGKEMMMSMLPEDVIIQNTNL
jgi:hypothetical protein